MKATLALRAYKGSVSSAHHRFISHGVGQRLDSCASPGKAKTSPSLESVL